MEEKDKLDNKDYQKMQNSLKRIQLSERNLLENSLRPYHKIPEERFIYREECKLRSFNL